MRTRRSSLLHQYQKELTLCTSVPEGVDCYMRKKQSSLLHEHQKDHLLHEHQKDHLLYEYQKDLLSSEEKKEFILIQVPEGVHRYTYA
jgi:hypothetical protein